MEENQLNQIDNSVFSITVKDAEDNLLKLTPKGHGTYDVEALPYGAPVFVEITTPQGVAFAGSRITRRVKGSDNKTIDLNGVYGYWKFRWIIEAEKEILIVSGLRLRFINSEWAGQMYSDSRATINPTENDTMELDPGFKEETVSLVFNMAG